VFSKEEIKELITKASNNWLFPDFTNKLTWYIALLGGTILVTTTALKEIFYNFLVDTVNLNSGNHFTLAELQSSSVEPLVGLGLIALALMHNLANKFLSQKSSEIALKDSRERQLVDMALFRKFLEDFPSNGHTVPFLRDHDLGGSYHDVNLTDINKFVENWDNVEYHFLDKEIEDRRAELWRKCRTFTYFLGTHSYDLNGGPMFSCVPDSCRGAWNYPEHVDQTLRELNEKATECYELHQSFAMLARQKLKC